VPHYAEHEAHVVVEQLKVNYINKIVDSVHNLHKYI
jgi:hypothetical protein